MSRNIAQTKCTECKLAVLGRCGVGKSATIVRYLTKRFIWEYDPTLEFVYRHQTSVDDEVVSMEILDTAGQEIDTIQREGHVRWGDGFLVIYSITDRKSFEEVAQIKSFLDEIKKARNVSVVIVANKCDLDHLREVSTEEGEKMAQELACAFYESSACRGDESIPEAFHELYREVRRRRAMEGNKSRRRSSIQQMKQVLNKTLTKINNRQ
ncbi:ras-related and estrogen-regulated growth inhibitor-like [Diadema setosum]|uniref:ras-related and estrogen-regulated growth inhibitor-like n=1 Tax=Diadema antillarum TaxID=105358 RepID=UPI003A891062